MSPKTLSTGKKSFRLENMSAGKPLCPQQQNWGRGKRCAEEDSSPDTMPFVLPLFYPSAW